MAVVRRWSRPFVALVVALVVALGGLPMRIVAAQEAPAFRHLTISDGLSQGAISAIVQDRRGFIWIGTKDGLNRYDGHQFLAFRHDPADSTSLASSDVTALHVDARGRLWVATRAGGVHWFDGGRERFVRVPSGPTREIRGFAEEGDGTLWLAAGPEGLFRLTAEPERPPTFSRVDLRADGAAVTSEQVRAVLVDRRGDLWVGTDSGLAQRVTAPGLPPAFLHRRKGADANGEVIDLPVTALHEDARGRLWIGSRPGVSMLDSARATMRHFYHRYRTYRYLWGEVIDIEDDQDGRLWVSTRSELMQLDPTSGQFVYVRHDQRDRRSINSDLPTALFRDRSNLMWVGTNGFGINVHDPKAERFHTYRRPELWTSRMSGFSVYTVFEDRQGAVWIDAGLLYRWDRATNTLRSFETTSDRPDDFGNTGVWSLIEESPGVLLAATYQGVHRYDVATRQNRLYRHDPRDAGSLPEQVVYDLFRDRDGDIWVVTENHLARLADPVRGRFERWRHKAVPTSGYWIFPSMTQDVHGALWFGSDQGLTRFDPRTETFRHFRHDPRNPRSLPNDAIRAITPDPSQPARALWIGTAGGGLSRFDFETEEFTTFTVRDGLPNNVVYSILPDQAGRLWLGTNKGLARFDPVRRQFRNFDVDDGLQGNEFNSGAAHRTRSGELFFGGTEGITYFRPEAVVDNPYAPTVVLTGFRRGNRTETVRDSATVLTRSIVELDTLRLSYRDAVVTFEFAALEYSAPSKNRYAYRLVGLNNEWFESGNVRAATYTNLPAGRYEFQVRASNNDGVWSGTPATLALVILPPWWQTPWAYVTYGLVLVGGAVFARRYEVARLRLASRLEREHLETEQLRRLERARSQLFANVSHEFRTPLTLTLGPLDDLQSGAYGPLPPAAVEQVHLARRNAARVLDLVNEVLELARAEAGRISLRARPIEVGRFVERLSRAFLPLAERNGIACVVQMPADPIMVYADEELLERAVSNVLSNACKFTPAGGSVVVRVVGEADAVLISVADTGPGIPDADRERIFERFHRVDSTAETHPGTGIGLALARELIQLHGGSIDVRSEVGAGSTFVIRLRLGSAHLAPDQLSADGDPARGPGASSGARPNAAVSLAAPLTPDRTGEIRDPASLVDEADVPTVLIVDDNAEIRAFVAQHLCPPYRVIEARDGQQGLDFARRYLPDLVLSDVMMPRMDGYALTRALKSSPETDFLPVILLTARAELDDRLAGLAEDADDYLTKPFGVAELRARIAATIANRRRLRERFGTGGFVMNADAGVTAMRSSPAPLASEDQRFIQRVQDAITRQLGDEDFTVERLAAEVAQSRGNLHRRLREICGETPSDMIRRIRLQRAAELLDAEAGTVAQVAYAVGFKSVAHFSNAFQAFHGIRPSQWRDRRT